MPMHVRTLPTYAPHHHRCPSGASSGLLSADVAPPFLILHRQSSVLTSGSPCSINVASTTGSQLFLHHLEASPLHSSFTSRSAPNKDGFCPCTFPCVPNTQQPSCDKLYLSPAPLTLLNNCPSTLFTPTVSTRSR